MSVISVYSKIPNLLKELRIAVPALNFYEISSSK